MIAGLPHERTVACILDRICDNCMSRVPAGSDKCPKCGIRFENTNPGGALPNGWVLGGRYTIGRYLELDGEGVTYSAIDGNTLQRVNIKEYMPVTLCSSRDDAGALLAKPGCDVLFKTTRMDFAELYSIILRMGLVEGLVQVLDVLEENNTAYAVLEKVEGPTLAEYLQRLNAPVEHGRVLSLMKPIMNGVEALHAASLVHRGVCTENIVLESGGTAKLGGYATLALRQQGSELKPKLYPGYSAPEQYSASEFEGRYTDVYAIGAVVYRMLTGEEPVSADERKMQDLLSPARAVDKEIPQFLSSALVRAMRVAPAERIQNISDLRLAFSGETVRQKTGPMGLTKQQLTVGLAALGAIAVLLIVVLLISLLGSGGKGDSSSSSDTTSISSSSSEEVTVPNFLGRVYQDVVNSSSYSQFVFANPEERASTSAEGVILEQVPEAGAVWDGSPIKLVISSGPEKVKVPDLVGKTKAEAISELENLDLLYSEETASNDGQYTAGEVVSTDPAAGTELDAGTGRVKIYVAGEVANLALPDFVGLTSGDVLPKLADMGLEFTQGTVENDKSVAKNGTVANTSPAAGQMVTPGKTNVIVNFYNNYKMPDIGSYVGQAPDGLQNFLTEHGIRYNTSMTVANDDVNKNGTIESIKSPPAGSEISSDTVVTIYVYLPAGGLDDEVKNIAN